MDFLLVIIELFSLGVKVEELRANIDWKSPFWKGVGRFGDIQNISLTDNKEPNTLMY